MDKVFKLKQRGTTVRTEMLAGLTTFMTMAYIVALNPNLLTNFDNGSPLWNGVFMATCLASAIGNFCMAFMANLPFVMAPGMGINSFFALVCGNIVTLAAVRGVTMTYTDAFQGTLCIVLVEGIVFLLLSIFNIRDKIVDAIPLCVRNGIGPAIGLMLMNIGLGSNLGIYAKGNGYTTPFYIMRDFFGALTPSIIKDAMGPEDYKVMVLSVVTVFVGLFIIVLFAKKNVKGAVLLGMLISAGIYWAGEAIFLDVNPFASLKGASFTPPVADMLNTTLFKFNFKNLLNIGWMTTVTLVVTFCIIDMFDTIGTLMGAASRGGLLDKNGKLEGIKPAMLADAIGTIGGSLTGTSTVTTFVESASGIAAGGKTGLTSLTAGILFLLCTFLAPVMAIIPAAATSPALIYVGILMLENLKLVDLSDLDSSVPVMLMLLAMPISGSIGHGIGLGLISYTVIKLFSGKKHEIPTLTYVLTLIFLVKFFAAV